MYLIPKLKEGAVAEVVGAFAPNVGNAVEVVVEVENKDEENDGAVWVVPYILENAEEVVPCPPPNGVLEPK